ncbi:hypothetical protein ACFOD4_20665 [Pseudoroseomonas globiformis]|uniref:Glycine zipper domain-containing protein n=1 Tax=Teichococcus globiformis TaxID=2307229 RepID=A0ABV7G440_9PROT
MPVPLLPLQAAAIPAPAESGTNAAGAALVGGLVGVGAGLLISELVNNNNDDWGQSYGHHPAYVVPPPYALYRSTQSGARYNGARALQETA